MKSLFSSFLLFLTFYSVIAQIPQGINYQAVVRGANGLPLRDSTKVAFEVEFLDLNDASLGTYDTKTDYPNLAVKKYGVVSFVIDVSGIQDITALRKIKIKETKIFSFLLIMKYCLNCVDFDGSILFLLKAINLKKFQSDPSHGNRMR